MEFGQVVVWSLPFPLDFAVSTFFFRWCFWFPSMCCFFCNSEVLWWTLTVNFGDCELAWNRAKEALHSVKSGCTFQGIGNPWDPMTSWWNCWKLKGNIEGFQQVQKERLKFMHSSTFPPCLRYPRFNHHTRCSLTLPRKTNGKRHAALRGCWAGSCTNPQFEDHWVSISKKKSQPTPYCR